MPRDATIQKTVSPTQGIKPGDTLSFTVKVHLASAKNSVVVQDILGGAGTYAFPSQTYFVPGSASFGPAGGAATSIADCTVVQNHSNWTRCDFTLGNLATGDYVLTYRLKLAAQESLGCYRNMDNDANLEAAGYSVHVATSRVAFSARCR